MCILFRRTIKRTKITDQHCGSVIAYHALNLLLWGVVNKLKEKGINISHEGVRKIIHKGNITGQGVVAKKHRPMIADC